MNKSEIAIIICTLIFYIIIVMLSTNKTIKPEETSARNPLDSMEQVTFDDCNRCIINNSWMSSSISCDFKN